LVGLHSIFFRYTLFCMAANKQGRGRPQKSSENKKSKSVLLRLQQREKDGFQEAADVAGVPLATWMRERLRRIAAQELEAVGRKNPFLS
jgi:hypothetical protein